MRLSNSLLTTALIFSAFSLQAETAPAATPTPTLATPATAAPMAIPAAPAIAAKAYVLMDYYTGQLLVESNAEERLPPASLTKMMTSYVVGQELVKGNIKPTDMVTISQNAWSKNYSDSSKMFIEVGKQVSVDDLNKGIIIQSGNDACVAMAEHLAGSTDSFAGMMNNWAASLGMKNSHFLNPHGLHEEGHYSTAHDMAILGQALIRDLPQEYAIYSQKSFVFNGITQQNRNRLLWDQTLQVDGIKTGHVSEIGYNLVASATNPEGMRLISVVLGTDSERVRAEESKKLLTYGFRFYQTLLPYKAGAELLSQKVWLGDRTNVKLGLDKDAAVTIARGQANNLKADFKMDGQLQAPLAKGQRVGTLYLKLGDKTLSELPLVTLEEVPEGSIFSRLWDYLMMFIDGVMGK